MAGRQIQNEANVMSMIEDMDEADGTQYDPADDADEGEIADEEGNGTDVEGPTVDNDGEQPTEDAAKTPDGKEEAKTDEPTGDKEGGLRKQGENHVDKHNNIVDPRTGAIIAKAGTERRLYEKTQRQTKILEPLQAKLAEYEKRDADVNTFYGAIKQAGLSTEEVGEAFNIAIAFKKDPVAASKMVLEQALALGHNVTDILGADAGNAIEMSGINKMLDKRLAPIMEPLQQQREEQQRRQEAEVALAKWVESKPYADVQLETIDDILGKKPDLTIDQAYDGLMVIANKYRLDITQPLGPQIQALESGVQTTPVKDNRQAPRTQRPLVNGSSSRPVNIDEKDIPDASSSWADIIKKSMPAA